MNIAMDLPRELGIRRPKHEKRRRRRRLARLVYRMEGDGGRHAARHVLDGIDDTQSGRERRP
jgi:hypothetical protein